MTSIAGDGTGYLAGHGLDIGEIGVAGLALWRADGGAKIAPHSRVASPKLVMNLIWLLRYR